MTQTPTQKAIAARERRSRAAWAKRQGVANADRAEDVELEAAEKGAPKAKKS